jgi:hypothetical protein
MSSTGIWMSARALHDTTEHAAELSLLSSAPLLGCPRDTTGISHPWNWHCQACSSSASFLLASRAPRGSVRASPGLPPCSVGPGTTLAAPSTVQAGYASGARGQRYRYGEPYPHRTRRHRGPGRWPTRRRWPQRAAIIGTVREE